ncbi:MULTISPECIES: hypothetical protein [Streptococcus]|nr:MULTISPECIES: hypothetical protein [Streptococcus]MBF0776320.1 hypothetical protein [Streptococcus sp. 19428wD3_AN2]
MINSQAGAGAILDALAGPVNPAGKLSETYPYALSDIYSSRDFPAR